MARASLPRTWTRATWPGLWGEGGRRVPGGRAESSSAGRWVAQSELGKACWGVGPRNEWRGPQGESAEQVQELAHLDLRLPAPLLLWFCAPRRVLEFNATDPRTHWKSPKKTKGTGAAPNKQAKGRGGPEERAVTGAVARGGGGDGGGVGSERGGAAGTLAAGGEGGGKDGIGAKAPAAVAGKSGRKGGSKRAAPAAAPADAGEEAPISSGRRLRARRGP
jgi:hypothetical protein